MYKESYCSATMVRLSVLHLIWDKNWLKDENGKGTMVGGSGMRLSWRLVEWYEGREWGIRRGAHAARGYC